MRTGQSVFIVSANRTAIGKGHAAKGQFRDVHAVDLLSVSMQAHFADGDVPPEAVDDVIVGCVEQYGEQSINVGRNGWLAAGLPATVPATTVDRQCGSGQQAVTFGASLISSGLADLVVAGGVEHTSRVPMSLETALAEQAGTPYPPSLLDRYDLVSQGVAAERVAEHWDLSRDDLDTLSLLSHKRASEATEAGRFAAETVPVVVADEPVTADQGIRPNTSMDALSGLPPVFESTGIVTAGNSSQISDGASTLLLASAEAVARYDVRPQARIVDSLTVGVDPVLMLEGPVPATQQLLTRARMRPSDVNLYEVNEAFASVLGMWLRELQVDLDCVNVNGGAIALGHPLGASGARLLTSLTHQLAGRDAERGVVTMCCRGGLGTATLIERVS